MDFGRRKTQKYVFKCPVLEDLRKLGGLVTDPEAFKAKYGGLWCCGGIPNDCPIAWHSPPFCFVVSNHYPGVPDF